jgi:hypothetical protein
MDNLTLTYIDKAGNEVKFSGTLKQLFNYLVDEFITHG